MTFLIVNCVVVSQLVSEEDDDEDGNDEVEGVDVVVRRE